MGPVQKRENQMNSSSAKSLATKSKLLALHFPAHQAVVPNIGWFNGMYLSEACHTIGGRNHIKGGLLSRRNTKHGKGMVSLS